MSPNILIIGATGNIGKPITEQVIAAKANFGRIAILTSQNTATQKSSLIEALKSQGVEIFVGDVASEHDVKKAYQGIDIVVSAVGRGAILTQIELIKWASETPAVKRFFPSEFGTDIEHNSRSPNEKPHQLKLKVRAYAKTVPNLHFTYLVTGPYSDWYMTKNTQDDLSTFDVKGKRAVLLGDGNGKVAFTTMADVGRLLVAAVLHPSAEEHKILIVNSFTATPNEIVAEFEKQTGAKWDVSYTSLEKLKEIEKAAWEAGEGWATGATLRRIWTEGGTLYDRPRDNALIGDPKVETLQDQVGQIIETQLKA